jgi:hypothetical protein
MTLMDASLPRPASTLADATEVGSLGIYQLKRYWSRTMAGRQRRFMPTDQHDRHLDHLVIHATGLGLEQTASYLGSNAPTFEEFERWILATTGGVEPMRVARINAAGAGAAYSRARLAADRRTRRRFDHLASSVAARQPAKPRHAAAHGPVHQYVSDPRRGAGRLALTARKESRPPVARRTASPWGARD